MLRHCLQVRGKNSAEEAGWGGEGERRVGQLLSFGGDGAIGNSRDGELFSVQQPGIGVPVLGMLHARQRGQVLQHLHRAGRFNGAQLPLCGCGGAAAASTGCNRWGRGCAIACASSSELSSGEGGPRYLRDPAAAAGSRYVPRCCADSGQAWAGRPHSLWARGSGDRAGGSKWADMQPFQEGQNRQLPDVRFEHAWKCFFSRRHAGTGEMASGDESVN